MDLCTESCSSVRPVGRLFVLGRSNINITRYTHTSQPVFSYMPYLWAPLTSNFFFFSGLDFDWESQDQRQNNSSGLHFLSRFSTDQDELSYGVDAIQVTQHDTVSFVRFDETMVVNDVLLTA